MLTSGSVPVLSTCIVFLSRHALSSGHALDTAFESNAFEALRAQDGIQSFVEDLEAVPEIADIVAINSGITVLAPIDSAWHRVDGAQRTSVPFLAWHILRGELFTSDVPVVEYEQRPGVIWDTFLDGKAMHTRSGRRASLINGTQALTAIALGSQDNLLVFSGNSTISRIIDPDISYGNIVIHKVDRALELPTSCYETASVVGLWGYNYAVFMAGLDEAISDMPDSTSLLPTNEAFQDAMPFLWGASIEDFKRLVHRHIIPGHILWSHQFVNASYETAEGSNVSVDIRTGQKIWVENAMILDGSNKPVYNGVAHVISRVLIPPYN